MAKKRRDDKTTKTKSWRDHPQLQDIRTRYQEKLFSARLSDQINFPLILFKLLDQISFYATMDTELWKRSIDELESTLFPYFDDKYEEEIRKLNLALDETVEEIVADEVLTSEEEVFYEADLDEYYKDKKEQLMALMHRNGMLGRQIIKWVGRPHNASSNG